MAVERTVGRKSIELNLRVLGFPISVFLDAGVTLDLASELRRAWSRCLDLPGGRPSGALVGMLATEGTPGARQFRARVSSDLGTLSVAADTFREFASELTSTITLAGITTASGELVMLHASALADPETGRAVALVGRSGMGKTTATKVLGADLGYVSDETVAIDRSGFLVPYAKPLSVIVESPPAPKHQIGPDELGLLVAPTAPTLATVVLLDRSLDANQPKITPLGHAEAIIELAPHTSALSSVRRPLQRICEILDASGGAIRATYREAGDLAALVPMLLERPAIAKTWVPVIDAQTRPGPGLREEGNFPSGLLRRAELVDAVEIPLPEGSGTELLAMTSRRVVRLSGVAPAIWRALATPADMGGIAERIAPDVGLPAGYEGLLRSGIEELESHEILQRT